MSYQEGDLKLELTQRILISVVFFHSVCAPETCMPLLPILCLSTFWVQGSEYMSEYILWLQHDWSDLGFVPHLPIGFFLVTINRPLQSVCLLLKSSVAWN